MVAAGPLGAPLSTLSGSLIYRRFVPKGDLIGTRALPQLSSDQGTGSILLSGALAASIFSAAATYGLLTEAIASGGSVAAAQTVRL